MNEDELRVICPSCDGRGQYEEIDGAGYVTYYKCRMCNGEGDIPKSFEDELTAAARSRPVKKNVDNHDFDDVALF